MTDTMIDVAFTGSRDDPNPWQLMTADCVLTYLWRIGYRRFHQGDCIGSDARFAELARRQGYWIIAHPPTDETRRAFYPADEKRDPLPFAHRNAIIVHESSVGLATPLTDTRTAHSGTWQTVARMKAKGIPHYVCGPTIMRRVG